MSTLQEKINYIKWLKYAGIKYYCSQEKDSKNSFLQKLGDTKAKCKNKTEKKLKATINERTQQNKNFSEQELIMSKNEYSNSQKLIDNATNLKELKDIVKNFNGCALKNFANNTVFCDGVDSAKIMFIGEAPGAKEDEKGIPFCGDSGILLDKMLATIALDRKKNIYLTNTVFWRPPANRNPTRDEIEICRPFVEKHISLLAPKLIILIGGTAANALLGKKNNISDIKENYYPYINKYLKAPIPTTAMFHPAFLLRQPSKKKDTWYDLLRIKDFIKKESIIIN